MNPNLERLAKETKNPQVSLDDKPIPGFMQPEALVFVDAGKVYALIEGMQKELVCNPHEESIRAVCFHDNDLYVGGSFGVETIAGERITDSGLLHLFSVDEHLWISLGSYIGTLCDLNSNQAFPAFYTIIWSIHSEGNHVWYSTQLKEKEPAKLGRFEINGKHLTNFVSLELKDEPIHDICTHKGEVYYVAGNEIFKLGSEKPEANGERIAAITSANGQLYASEFKHVTDVFTGKKVAKGDEKIVDMCAVPIEWLKRSGYL
jgi:hypothetical protein